MLIFRFGSHFLGIIEIKFSFWQLDTEYVRQPLENKGKPVKINQRFATCLTLSFLAFAMGCSEQLTEEVAIGSKRPGTESGSVEEVSLAGEAVTIEESEHDQSETIEIQEAVQIAESEVQPAKPAIRFRSAEDALKSFLGSYGSEKESARQYLISNASQAVPCLIQEIANTGGATGDAVRSFYISSVLVEIGDAALPSLSNAKTRIDQYLEEELRQRAYDSAAYGTSYGPPPVVGTLMSVRASIEHTIEEIQSGKN